jgi:hypothetical protein
MRYYWWHDRVLKEIMKAVCMIDQLHTLILRTFCDQYAVAADRYLSSVQRDIDWYEASGPMGIFLFHQVVQGLSVLGDSVQNSGCFIPIKGLFSKNNKIQ